MNEDYITFHEPEPIASEASFHAKKGKRKSASSSGVPVEVAVNTSRDDLVRHVFKSFTDEIEEAKNKIQQDLLDSIFKNTFDYFNAYYQKRHKSSQLEAMNSRDLILKPLSPLFNIIPTIALFTGINIQDYTNLCEKLCLNLKQNLTQHLFVVNETNCQSMKTLTYSLFSQLEAINNGEEKSIKRNLYTFRSFFDLILNDQTNSKTKSIIFIFKQFELIAKDIVENFFSVASCYVEKISIFFIIELASQSSVLYEHLSGSAISKLCIKKLYSMPANDYMNSFMTQVFIDNLTNFKLSGALLKFLIDIYNNYNFSISHFIHALKFCLYDHLQNDLINPIFLSNAAENSSKQLILDVYEHELSLTKSNLKDLVTSQHMSKDFLESLYQKQEEWFSFNNQYSLLVRIIFEIISSFPSESKCLGDHQKSFTNASYVDLYVQISSLISGNPAAEGKRFCELEHYQNMKKLLQLSSSSTLNDIIKKIIQAITAINMANYSIEFVNDIVKLSEILAEHNVVVYKSDNEEDVNEVDVSPKKSVKRSQSTSRKSKPLLDNSNISTTSPSKDRRRKTQSTVVNNLSQSRNKFIEWLNHQCSKHFDKDYTTAFLNSKYFCYVDMKKLKERLFVSQRVCIHEALVSPFKYLSEKSVLKNESDKLPISIIYKLYLECGHMINLFDWLQAFVDKMENCDLSELDEKKRKHLQALFFRAITELQFLGYIKQTSRKVDHVVKLTNISYNPDDA